MEFDVLMQQFAAKFGLDGVEIENDTAALEIDGIAFGFICEPSDDTLTVVADLGQQSINADGAFGSMMLKANFLFQVTKGATLFQNPENDTFGLEQRYRLVDLDVDALSAQIEKLANLAEDWRAIVAGAKKAEEIVAAKNVAEQSQTPFSAGDFMRV